ncbi:MAG: SUF system NifU family Fe-S cluster assembly protein [Candidatus Omnitrophica bacterium]|nr:SUF system NifU family Fe-S cluster assembly protein [Candidatus Omnitrophota bacterium]
MIEQLDELYRDVILDHFKRSRHAGTLAGAQISANGANPLCGDELTFHLMLDDDRITQVRFQGKGCAISQAASSMLAAQLEGYTIGQATQLIESLKAFMRGQAPDPATDLGDLEALAGVRKFPVRIKCAALSWNVVEQGLTQYRGEGKSQKEKGKTTSENSKC